MKIFLAGHRGMVGRAIHRQLAQVPEVEVLTAPRDALDLRDQSAVANFMQHNRPDQVILAAAKVGGIAANAASPATFAYDNLMIATNVIHQAYCHGVERLLFLGSSCIYPKHAPQPIKETDLLTGALEPTNAPYAVAKIAGLTLCESYNRQYGTDYRCIMPSNLYGPFDNFDPTTAHVLPALVRRFCAAVASGKPEVVIWGSGQARREFLHVDDLASAALTVLKVPQADFHRATMGETPHLNVGTGADISIQELAQRIAQATGFQGRIVCDPSKPDGTPQKLLDVSGMARLGWQPHISLENGLRTTVAWFRQHLA